MNKRLLGIFIAVAVAVVVIVVCCVMFLTGSVEVRTTDNLTLEDETVNAIITQSGIRKGESVFAIDESEAVNAVEKANPTLKVVDIERKFPNNVYIYVTDRTGVFSLRLADGRYAVLDRELKVTEILAENDDKLCILDGVAVTNVKEGYVLDDSQILLTMMKGAERCSFINARYYSFIRKTQVLDKEIWLTTNTGVIICLPISSNIDQSMINAYGYYLEHTSDTGKTSGKIVLSEDGWVWQNS